VSEVCIDLVEFIAGNFQYLLNFHPILRDHAEMDLCADAIHHTCMEDNAVEWLRICGFIDGTKLPTQRPIHGQESVYSGHKWIHCLLYQGITIANGIAVRIHGPESGRYHDLYILHPS